MSKPHVNDLLAGMADGRYPLRHDTFTDHPSPRTARHMRDLLVSCGILPGYDRNLDRLTTWVNTTLATTDIRQSRDAITGFATWNHLRKLRDRAERHPLPDGAIRNATQEITVAIDFVNWLHRRGTPLKSTTQPDIDDWIATGPSTRSTALMFVKWCTTQQHLRPGLHFPRRAARTTPIASDAERYAQLARILAHRDIAPWIQAATVLLLVCAQPVTRIAALRLDAVTATDRRDVTISFSENHTAIPDALAAPILDLLEQRPHMNTAANATSPWLFPGTNPGQHINPQTLMKVLRANGIELRGARNSAMRELVQKVSPAIVASQFGYRPQTTERHALGAGTTWSSYPNLH